MSRMVYQFHCRWTRQLPYYWISWCPPWILPNPIAHLDRVNWLRIIRIYHIAASAMQIDRHDELLKLVRWPTKSQQSINMCVIVIWLLLFMYVSNDWLHVCFSATVCYRREDHKPNKFEMNKRRCECYIGHFNFSMNEARGNFVHLLMC